MKASPKSPPQNKLFTEEFSKNLLRFIDSLSKLFFYGWHQYTLGVSGGEKHHQFVNKQ